MLSRFNLLNYITETIFLLDRAENHFIINESWSTCREYENQWHQQWYKHTTPADLIRHNLKQFYLQHFIQAQHSKAWLNQVKIAVVRVSGKFTFWSIFQHHNLEYVPDFEILNMNKQEKFIIDVKLIVYSFKSKREDVY